MPELTVVVPAFRERENIPGLLRALEAALAGLDWETVIVCDDAFDGTLASSAPFLAVIDADLQHDETLMPKLLQTAKQGDADIVVASRYMEGASTGELAARRVRISRFASALSRVLAKGLSDPMSGYF